MIVTIILGTAASAAPARNDDVRVSSLQVAITFDGMPTAYFRSVSGISVEIEVVEFREGGSSDVHKIPGRVKYPNLVLKQGFTGVSELQKWAFQIAAGQFVHRNATIVISDLREGPDLDASKSEIAIETIEIAHEGLSYSTDP